MTIHVAQCDRELCESVQLCDHYSFISFYVIQCTEYEAMTFN
jgi:hypothetical protein